MLKVQDHSEAAADQPFAYRPRQFARKGNISESKVWKMLASGELPSFKVGRARLIPASAIDNLIAGAGK